jgi:hypothetical protein
MQKEPNAAKPTIEPEEKYQPNGDESDRTVPWGQH